jgi:hypothetical protein
VLPQNGSKPARINDGRAEFFALPMDGLIRALDARNRPGLCEFK